MAQRNPIPDPTSGSALEALRRLFGRTYARDFSIELWDGTTVRASDNERYILRINAPYALRSAFSPPINLNPGRAFVEHLIDVEGDLGAAVQSLEKAVPELDTRGKLGLALALARMPRAPREALRHEGEAHPNGAVHSPERDAEAIGYHYDQPAAFYRTFLDPQLVYSCAYYDDGVTTLADAQRAKIDYTLKKLRLREGEVLLDIGCGWGALVVRAAQLGARVLGITLSRAQLAEGRRRIAELGLGERAGIELLDYRELGELRFDKIVSIGMVEHVGRERMGQYFAAAFRALRPGGLFLNHGIAEQSPGGKGYRASGFIGRYIFPDGDLLPVSRPLAAAEQAGFEIRDVENLREHYARTLRAWVANIERNANAAIAAAGERTFRAWRLYMAGSAEGFASGRMALFQALLAKPGANGEVDVPPTRRSLYEGV